MRSGPIFVKMPDHRVIMNNPLSSLTDNDLARYTSVAYQIASERWAKHFAARIEPVVSEAAAHSTHRDALLADDIWQALKAEGKRRQYA